uniref:LAM_G_DOMAIN domain-containing protein n=1 Tax=Steinernema glaseri TaxID=37863 RepID=A0A1I8A3A0_9BILA
MQLSEHEITLDLSPTCLGKNSRIMVNVRNGTTFEDGSIVYLHEATKHEITLDLSPISNVWSLHNARGEMSNCNSDGSFLFLERTKDMKI